MWRLCALPLTDHYTTTTTTTTTSPRPLLLLLSSTGAMVGVSHSPNSPVSTTERVGNISDTTGSRQLREMKRDSSQLDGSTALWIDGGT